MVRKWSIEDFRHLNVNERLALIDALTESMEKKCKEPQLTETQKREFDAQQKARIFKGQKPHTEEFLRMSVDERIELIGDIWDSIPAEALPPLTEAQQKELERRIADYRQNPSSSMPWEVVKAQLQKRLTP